MLYEDVAIAADMKQANIPVLKKILWLIASSVPFQVNIEKMSRELGISKQYVYQYVDHLDTAGLINAVPYGGTGYRSVRKPANSAFSISAFVYPRPRNANPNSSAGLRAQSAPCFTRKPAVDYVL